MTCKAFPYFLCIFLAAIQANAQVIYERTFPNEFPSIQIPLELSDFSTFSLGSNSECGGLRTRHIDVYGNELSENILYAEAFSSGNFWIGHDSVLIWAEHGAYDVGPDSFRVHIWTPGEIKNVLSISIRDDFTPSRRYGAYLYTPERLVFNRTDTLYTKNLYTSIVDDSIIIRGISQIFEFEKSILVLSETGEPLLLDDRLEEIYEWDNLSSLPFDIYSAAVLDSFLVGVSELNSLSLGIVNVYDESKETLDMSTYFDQVDDVQANKNFLFVKGISNGDPLVLQVDKEFEEIDLVTLDIPNLNKQMTFHYFPDRVYAWGYDGLANYNANYRMSYHYLDAHPIKYFDLSLDTAWVDSVYNFPEHFHIPSRVYISAVVRNLSLEPIQSLTIHWEREPYSWCDPGVYPTHQGGLSVSSNESDTITFQTWSFEVAHNLPYFETFFAQHGNHHLDSNLTDNIFELAYVTSNINETISGSIFVNPNPFTDHLRITDAPESSQVILYDQTGRLVARGYEQLENLGHLTPGIYVLHVITGSSTGVSKVLKVE